MEIFIMPYLDMVLLLLSWVAYLTLHSVLADTKVKASLAERFPEMMRFYRLIYSVVSIMGLFGIGWMIARSTAGKFYEGPEFLKYLGLIVGSWGVYMIKLAFRNFSFSGFIGFGEEEYPVLVRAGIHDKIRHPIYSGIVLLMTGMTLAVLSWAVLVSTIAIFCYLPIGIYLEEKKLIAQFGDDYVNYKKEVPALIPRF